MSAEKPPDYSVLAVLWKKLIFERNITAARLYQLTQAHITKQIKLMDEGRIKKKTSLTPSSIIREYDHSVISLSRFLEGLRIINIRKIKITIEITDDKSIKSTHEIESEIR